MIFVSPLADERGTEDAAKVVRAALGGIDPERVTLAQALLDQGDTAPRRALLAAGFRDLTTLSYLSVAVPADAAMPVLPDHCECLPWSEERRAAFLEALDASYVDTLDCPELQELRHTEDVLAGHMATGRFDPAWWTLLRIEGRVAGVMLLNPVPDMACVELVYLGIAPDWRGRGWGRWLLARALGRCARAGIDRLTLAADERNAPALQLYAGAGFRCTSRKLVMIRPLKPT